MVDKLDWKPNVHPEEVEEVFFQQPIKLLKSRENKRLLYGRSSEGRYLFIVFVWIKNNVKVISARDMTHAERRYFKK